MYSRGAFWLSFLALLAITYSMIIYGIDTRYGWCGTPRVEARQDFWRILSVAGPAYSLAVIVLLIVILKRLDASTLPFARAEGAVGALFCALTLFQPIWMWSGLNQVPSWPEELDLVKLIGLWLIFFILAVWAIIYLGRAKWEQDIIGE